MTIGASSLGSEELIGSNSPNATVDPLTGEVTLTLAAQQSIDTVASQILLGLQSTNPSLYAIITTLLEINLGSLSAAGPTGEGNEDAQTIDEVAAAIVSAIVNGESVTLVSSQGTLTIAAPVAVTGALSEILVASQGTALAQANPSPVLVTSAVFTPVGGTPMVMPLRGTLDQIANAAGFLAASFAAGLTPSQVATFTEMALVGVDYVDLVELFNAVSGLLPAQSQPQETVVDATQLEAAIQAYNRILDETDPAALVTLGEFEDFVVLGRSLQQLRAAVDTQTASD
ncbi:hypothetical protein C7293_10525 [filamentous cyanobacterium CCT1]|nr:hypothetical protein C7293_10525 [filamentous cyanobacterium CCT1]PSN78375.1 hypothetical protein C8B47_17185 [filamentous cyanobacterium CCP4]